MPHPALDILTKLGDAVSGVDPTARYKNQIGIDHVQAETDASLALAKERRIQAEMAEQERAALERIGMTSTGTFGDTGAAPIGDLIVAKRGGDYSGAMQGRNHAQEFNERAVVEQPAALGDVAAEASRQANLDALAPGSAVALRRPSASGAPVIVQGDEGPTYVAPRDAPGRTPAARPLAPRQPTQPGPTTQERNIASLESMGVPRDVAIGIVYNDLKDPRSDYVRIRNTLANQKDAAFRPLYTPEQLDGMARQAVEAVYGVGSLEHANQGPIPPPASAAPPGGRPPLDSFFK